MRLPGAYTEVTFDYHDEVKRHSVENVVGRCLEVADHRLTMVGPTILQ